MIYLLEILYLPTPANKGSQIIYQGLAPLYALRKLKIGI